MKSAFEYLQNAAKCEEKAQTAATQANRWSLLKAARSWQLLAREAAKAERLPTGPSNKGRHHIRS
jgi:hypothetical protein